MNKRDLPLLFWFFLNNQSKMNKKYSGDNWKQHCSLTELEAACECEFGEFLAEVKPWWCWWKPNVGFIHEKAVEEFIDYLMFTYSFVMKVHDIDECVDIEHVNIICDTIEVNDRRKGDLAAIFSHKYKLFQLKETGVKNKSEAIRHLIAIMYRGMKLLGIDQEILSTSYNKKFEANVRRLESGVHDTGVQ